MTSMVLGDSTLESLTTSVNALVHFKFLYPIATTNVICVFSLLAIDMHIVDPTSHVLLFFWQLQ
jgi:hypothetical protein